MRTDTADHWLIIINPEAAGGNARKLWPKYSGVFNGSIDFTQHTSLGLEDMTQTISRAYQTGTRNFAILGGDGSMNVLINALFQIPEIETKSVRVALLPAGTGNDWKRTHNIPQEAAEILKLMQKDSFVWHDLGKVSYSMKNQYFINLLGTGLDAKAVRFYHSHTSRWGIGKLKYMAALLMALFSYRRVRVKMHLDHASELKLNGKVLNLNIGIGKYSGGGIRTIPHANFNDGKLEGVVVEKIGLFKVLLNLPNLFNGKYIQLKEVGCFSTKHVKLEFENPEYIEADGELMGPAKEYEVEVIPSGIHVLSNA